MKLTIAEHIKTIPVLRPLIFFLGGMLISFNHGLHYFIAFCLLIILSGLLVKDIRIRKAIWGSLFLSLFFLLGSFCQQTKKDPDPVDCLEGVFIAEICDYPVEKEKSRALQAELFCFNDSVLDDLFTVKTQLYFPKEGIRSDCIEPGKRIIFRGKLERIKNYGNPGEFDYAGFLKRKNIFYSGFIKKDELKVLSDKRDKLRYHALKLRKELQNRITKIKSRYSSEARATLMAIGMGDKSGLERETKTDFSNAGAIHIMAVSGLHVGLIWMFFNFLTAFAAGKKAGKCLQFLFISFIIWGYALFTGLSTSVTRSCLMFTIVGFGSVISKKPVSLNTVFLAAFIQLLMDPDVLQDLGFQFSYTAVFGILLFQKIIRGLFPSGNRIVSYFFDLISVSLSAQVLTFPLTIHYFHQFPVYFLLTNILVIPLVTLIMFLFILSCFVLFLPAVYDFIIEMVLFLTEGMNQLVGFISHLPGSVIGDQQLSIFQLILLLILPFLVLGFRYYKIPRYLYFFFLLFSISLGYGAYNFLSAENSDIVVFNVPGKTCIHIFNGSNYLLTDDQTEWDEYAFFCGNFLAENYRSDPSIMDLKEFSVDTGIQEITTLPGEGNFIYNLGNFRVLVLSDYKAIGKFRSEHFLEVETLILTSGRLWDLDLSSLNMNVNNTVLTSAVFPGGLKYLDTMKIGENYVYVAETGAFFTGKGKFNLKK